MNISQISPILVAIERFGVIPVDRPVVPNADATSKIIWLNGCSTSLTFPPYSLNEVTPTTMTNNVINKADEKTINDLETVSGLIDLLNIVTCFLPLSFDHRATIIIPIVVVLIPPAVDEGAEPMNISIA